MTRWLRAGLLIAAALLVFTFALIFGVRSEVAPRAYARADDVPPDASARVAVVFGAGLNRDGSASPLLYDRVAVAVDLWKAGRVNTLLLSGDNRIPQHNEPLAMQRAALALGAPSKMLVLDYAGWHTYDTCYRAKEIFGVQRAIVVTQQFHLPRALYTCLRLGIDTLGVAADRRDYGAGNYDYWTLREYPSLLQAFLDVNVLHPEPVLGDKMPIDNK